MAVSQCSVQVTDSYRTSIMAITKASASLPYVPCSLRISGAVRPRSSDSCGTQAQSDPSKAKISDPGVVISIYGGIWLDTCQYSGKPNLE